MHECDWCGDSCDEYIQALRTVEIVYITGGLVDSAASEPVRLYFCSRVHRHYYFTEP